MIFSKLFFLLFWQGFLKCNLFNFVVNLRTVCGTVCLSFSSALSYILFIHYRVNFYMCSGISSKHQTIWKQQFFSSSVFNTFPHSFPHILRLSFFFFPVSTFSWLSSSPLSDEWCYGFGAALGVLCEFGDLRLFLRLEPGSGCVERVSSSSFHFSAVPDLTVLLFLSLSVSLLRNWTPCLEFLLKLNVATLALNRHVWTPVGEWCHWLGDAVDLLC